VLLEINGDDPAELYDLPVYNLFENERNNGFCRSKMLANSCDALTSRQPSRGCF